MPETAFKGSQLAKARSQLAIAHRGTRDPQAIEDAYRDFATAKIENYVLRVLADSPPLTDEQRTRLIGLLRPVAKHEMAKTAKADGGRRDSKVGKR